VTPNPSVRKVADRSSAPAEREFWFGPFRLLPAQQLLLEGEAPLRVGSRALEILAALVERPGELVSKGELIARAWPNTFVEESNLKVHVAVLRRALGEGQVGRRYVATVPGRGYRFVAPVEVSEQGGPPAQRGTAASYAHNLPASLTRTIGRADTIETLVEKLARLRLVTLVGPGGIGKTTVALAVAQAVVANYDHGVWFVDLAPLQEPQFVPSALASVLGLTIHSENAVAALTASLRDKQTLLVLDSCEHVIDAAASLAEQIIRSAPRVQILATSRESLRAAGEHVYRLSPLESPPDSPGLTAAKALSFSSVQLFVERAAASLDGFELTDADAPVVAEICRKLEGVALAIELAATRIDAFAVRELSALLNDRFRLLNQGRRGALARHRSLAAALDWSYELLPEDERVVLRRLSVFAGTFTLDSAQAVAGNDGAASGIIDGVASLVAKSLVSADVSGAVVYYRLLDTTRAYALHKLTESGELGAFLRRHAEYNLDLFARAETEWEAQPSAQWLADYRRKIDDVRAALTWAFSPGGDVSIGVALTVAAIPLWMHLSLMDECRVCVERALASDGTEARRSERDEMKLYAALGGALLYARGPLPDTDVVWTKALRIAERIADAQYQLRALWGLSIYRVYVGDYQAALWLAKKFRAVAVGKGDEADRLSGDRLTATALYYLGDPTEARSGLDRMLRQYVAPVRAAHIARFQFDQRVAARSTLSNILWLQGCPDQAVRTAQSAVEDARATDHALSLFNALGHAACPIALYVGDLAAAESLLAMLLDHLAKRALTAWNALGHCLQGMLLIKRGDVTGLAILRRALDELHEMRFGLRCSAYLGALAAGLGAAGQVAEGQTSIHEALEWSERSGERWCFAELLRIKGDLLRMERTPAGLIAAQDHYMQALEWARRQQALSWELRAATSLAELWHPQGKTGEAVELLSSVYGRFNEGYQTGDLKTARALIEELQAAQR
jgi:predicted ATPase/DNA-binding winged helix-turn-helix (wHTH) protein